jgi:hypothetical protein
MNWRHAGNTDHPTRDGRIEVAQRMPVHWKAKTTGLYDRPRR